MQKMTKALLAFIALIACASVVGFGCGGDVPVSKGVEDPSGAKPAAAGANGAKTNGDGAANAGKTKAE